MDAENRPIRPDELLTQLGWVRSLARSLVFDSEMADDVLQQVCLLALQKAPREAREGPRLRAWLAAVTRSLARRSTRTDSRRLRREQAAAQSEAQPSTAEIAQRREALRALVDAVTGLDEPYFSTVVERYFEGLSVSDIAARHGLSTGAVRQRLSRAKQQLRVRLVRLIEDEPGGWLRSVLPLAPIGGSILEPMGGLVLAKHVGLGGVAKLCLALLITVSLIFTGRWLLSGGADEPSTVVADSGSTSAGAASDTPEALARGEPPIEPVALAASGSEVAALDSDDVVMRRELLAVSIVGRVVDEAGVPLPGATVELLRPTLDSMQALGGRPREDLRLVSTLTDAEGRFALPASLPPDMHLPQRTKFLEPTYGGPDLLAQLPGRLPAVADVPVAQAGERQVGDVVLPLGAALAVIARDEHGAVARGVAVTLDYGKSPLGRAGRVARDDIVERDEGAGRFVAEALPGGTAAVTITATGLAPVTIEAVTLTPGQTTDLGSVELGAAATLAGAVTDERGQPVRDAWVIARPAQQFAKLPESPADLRRAADSRRAHAMPGELRLADAEGAFQVDSLMPGRYGLAVGAPGHASTVLRSIEVPGPPASVTLLPAGRAQLSFVDAESGLPVEPQSVQARNTPFDWTIVTLEPSQDESGRTVYSLDPGSECWVFVRCSGYASQVCKLAGLEAGQVRDETVPLARGCVVRGQVIDSTGAGLANRGVLVLSGDMQLRDFGAEYTARTDADGRFEIGPLAPSKWWGLSAGGGAYGVRRTPLSIEDGQREIELTLQLEAAASVSGRVLDARGNPQGGCIVTLMEGERPNDLGLQTLADESGRYGFRGLLPGQHQVICHSPQAQQSFTVAAGEQATVDLIVPAPGRISGRVTSGGGSVSGATVQLYHEGFGDLMRFRTTTTDERGDYGFEDLRFGRYGVSATPPVGSESPILELALAPGADAIADLDLSGGTITGLAVIEASGEPLAGVFVTLKQERGVLSPPTHQDGAFRFELVRPGSVLIEGAAKGYATLLRRVEVGSDPSQPATVRLEFEPGAIVEGAVRAPEGQISHRDLTLRLTRDDEPDFASKVSIDEGHYRVQALAPGSYRAAILDHGTNRAYSPSGAVLVETTFTISAGQVLQHDMTLPGT